MSKYDSNFHPKDLLERMSQGELNIQVAASWKISEKTFYAWLKDYPELQASYEIGLTACEAWWITKMKGNWENEKEKGFKYCALIMNTKFGYKENQSPNNTVTHNTINVQGNMNLIQNKSREDLIELIRDGLEDNNIIEVIPNGSEQKDR